tara:strand:- start:5473 stop:6309 length:837 start_codon:yes stop_codon:yes gene_type:complete
MRRNIIYSKKTPSLSDYFNSLKKYNDLIFFLTKRDFTVFYKSTVLGPLWYIIQPFLNSVVFMLIFNKLAKIPTTGVPAMLFYFCGSIFWQFYSEALNRSSRTLLDNKDLYSKIYFPRIIQVISTHIISFIKLLVQIFFFIAILLVFIFNGYDYTLSAKLLLLPFLLLYLCISSIGIGMLFASLTIKYRDIIFALTFGLQMFMYATPVVYSFTLIPEKYKIYASFNPVGPCFEMIKNIIFNQNLIDFKYMLISFIISIIIFLTGFILFLKRENDFIDKI